MRGTITAIDDAAIHAVGFLGDTDGDGYYGGTDALRDAQRAVSIGTGFIPWALLDPVVIGDVTGDGLINGVDALRLAQQAVSIAITPNPFPSQRV